MSKTSKVGVLGAGFGFCMPIILELVLYFGNPNSIAFQHSLSLFYILAPTSLGLAAAEWRTLSERVFFVLFFAFANALLYGLVGLIVGSIWNVLSKRSIRQSR